jgi:hypothetical protein
MVKLLYYKQISRDIIEDVRKTTRYHSSVLMINELYIVSLKGKCNIFLGQSGVSCRSFAGETRCVGTTRMSPPWILRRLAKVSPFFNSLSNRLRITNYCLRSVPSSLLKFTRIIQGNLWLYTLIPKNKSISQMIVK